MGMIQKAMDRYLEAKARKIERFESEARHAYAKIADKVDSKRKLGHKKGRKRF